jgi:putative ABC transport system permease protein
MGLWAAECHGNCLLWRRRRGRGRAKTQPPQWRSSLLTPGLFAADGAVFASGSPYNTASSLLKARVAVLGSGAAAELGVDVTAKSPTVVIDGVPFTIIGVISDVDRQASLLRAVVIPTNSAVALWGQPGQESEPTLSVRVRTGAAAVVGTQIAKALDPAHPELFTVQTSQAPLEGLPPTRRSPG